jgi:perosamine synthetase
MIHQDIERIVKSVIKSKSNFIGLHEPSFDQNDIYHVGKSIRSTFVSTMGEYILKFEKQLKKFTKSKFILSTNSGSSALHLALKTVGVTKNTNVILSPLTFVATANAIKYNDAELIFIDVDKKNFCLCHKALQNFIIKRTYKKNGKVYCKSNKKILSAVIVTHVFGSAANIKEIIKICKKYKVKLIEDAAESLGSFVSNRHLGTFGDIGVLSFNGNKIITTGSGGCILTNNSKYYNRCKHLASVAKLAHPWQFIHDEVGWNYRLNNLCASLGYSQLEKLNTILKKKRKLKNKYKKFFKKHKDISIIDFELAGALKSNNWLIPLDLGKYHNKRNFILEYLNSKKIQSRPIWKLITSLKPYKKCENFGIKNAKEIEKKIIFLPSSPGLV